MRIEQVTFTRFLAAISVVVYHYGRHVFPFGSDYIITVFDNASISVSYFFILSGFVMVFAYGKRAEINVTEYFISRFARIYPVYLLAILLILTHYILNKQVIDLSGVVLNILVIQSWIPLKAISFNSPGWTLAVEFFFYALFPFLLRYVYNKFNYKNILITIVILWVISQFGFNLGIFLGYDKGVDTLGHNILFYFPVMHLSEFLIGNIAGIYFLRLNQKAYKNYDLLITSIGVIFILILVFPSGLNYHNGLLAVLFVPMILLLSLNTGKITQLFNQKALIFLGEISYGVYILQYPVFTWTRSLLKHLKITEPYLIFYISTIALVLAAGISYRFFETPVRNKIRNFRTKKSLNPVM